MEEIKIKKRVEPFLHAVPIIYSLTVSIYILSIGYFNPTGPACWIEAPQDIEIEDIEEARNYAMTLKWVGTGAPLCAGFGGNCIILVI